MESPVHQYRGFLPGWLLLDKLDAPPQVSTSTSTVYLLSISLLTAVSILVIRLFVRRDYMQRGQLTVGSAFLQAFIFFIYGGYPIIYLPGDWPETQVNLTIQVAGFASLTIGLSILLLGIFRLGILQSLGLNPGRLKKTDFYRLTRNPQVLGCFMYVIGFMMLWPSGYALSWGLSLMAIIHVMVLTEEEHLRNTYGQDYEQYCKSVPRYLGFPKKPERDKF